MFETIGSFSLNCSFILYLILYFPQLVHNKKSSNIQELSILLHLMIYLSYFFDLIYGFSAKLPWQYKTVSIVGLLLICIQHLQLLRLYQQRNQKRYVWAVLAILLVSLGLLYCFFLMSPLSSRLTLISGILARGCGLLYCLPQVIRNKNLQSANSLSPYFLWLNCSLAGLDTLSAFCLDWGWPNQVAAPLTALVSIILIAQNKYYLKYHSKNWYIDNIRYYPKNIQ